MKVLLINPSFPASFWSFEGAIKLLGRKSLLPPLGLLTVAALLPQDWEFRLIDRDFETVTEADWDWAELIMITGMIVQREDMLNIIKEAKARAKMVAVGGPYAMSLPDEILEAGADYAVLDEGEITIPLFLEALKTGATSGTFTANGQKPDITTSPKPRYDLIDINNYDSLSIQFSRGCPFLCEFCDIITLFGRKPRTKSPEQIIEELNQLYDLGWRGGIFMVDDNFIGNRITVRPMLKAVIKWQRERNFPFILVTEASVDLAEDEELMKLMRQANFANIFIGIETPDEGSLERINKKQNVRGSLIDRVKKINEAGFRIMGGFIIGFDGEEAGAGQRILDFAEEANIPVTIVSLLQALPKTALTDRLRAEGRLLGDDNKADLNSNCLTNFVPTRPLTEIAEEHIQIYETLYDPHNYVRRAHLHSLATKNGVWPTDGMPPSSLPVKPSEIVVLLRILWQQGVVRSSRRAFWYAIFDLARKNKQSIKGFFTLMAMFEHFYTFRDVVKKEMISQLESLSPEDRTRTWTAPDPKVSKVG